MKIIIETDEFLDSKKSVITINGIQYKDVDNMQLRVAQNGNGELVIQHDSGYLEAYKAKQEVNNDL
jgi:hypothetical protein